MVSIAFPLFGLVEELWRRFCDFRFRLSRVPALLLAMSHTVCRHALGSVPRGYGAAPPCRHGSGDRWDMPRKVPVVAIEFRCAGLRRDGKLHPTDQDLGNVG